MSTGNPRYRRGRALEYLIKDKLEKQGYFMVRAAGSHGVADLVALRWNPRITLNGIVAHEVLFISCKIPQYAPPNERNLLITTAKNYGAIPMITVKNKSGQWELQRLDS